jgi:hypothetical protein
MWLSGRAVDEGDVGMARVAEASQDQGVLPRPARMLARLEGHGIRIPLEGVEHGERRDRPPDRRRGRQDRRRRRSRRDGQGGVALAFLRQMDEPGDAQRRQDHHAQPGQPPFSGMARGAFVV